MFASVCAPGDTGAMRRRAWSAGGRGVQQLRCAAAAGQDMPLVPEALAAVAALELLGSADRGAIVSGCSAASKQAAHDQR